MSSRSHASTGSVLAGANFLQYGRKLIFGDSKDHADGLDLSDDEHPVVSPALNDVAGVDQAQADDPVIGEVMWQ